MASNDTVREVTHAILRPTDRNHKDCCMLGAPQPIYENLRTGVKQSAVWDESFVVHDDVIECVSCLCRWRARFVNSGGKLFLHSYAVVQ